MSTLLSRLARYGGALLLAAFAAAYLTWLPIRPAGPPMTDFSAYYSAGRSWASGHDPYARDLWNVEKTLPGADPSRRELLPFVGPPLSLPLWALLGRLPYIPASVVWGVIIAACAGVILFAPAHLAGRPLRGNGIVSMLLFALAAGPLMIAISVGQAALPTCAAIDLAILAAVRRKWTWMALAVTVAAALKPNDALVLAGAIREFAALAALGAAALVWLIGNVPLAGGLHGALGYLSVVAHQSVSERFFAYQLTPTSIAYGFGLAPQEAANLGIAVAALAGAAAIVAIFAVRANAVDAVAIACAAFPFVIPFEHEPDMVIVFLPALLVVMRARGWAWVCGAVGAVLVCVDPFAMTQGLFGIIFTVVTIVVAALQLATFAPPDVRWPRLAPLGLIPLMLLLGAFAPAKHLPMWPNTLPRNVAVAPDASADSEWHDELVASGLEQQLPWASLLRLLTLCGCGCVTVAMIRTAATRTTILAQQTPVMPHVPAPAG